MPSSKSRSLRELAFPTNASTVMFGPGGPEKIITRSNLKTSIQSLDDLVSTCANYRAALVTMSKATAAFADAMERCSGLKGPSYEASTRLQAASGVHHLIGNQWHVLSDALDKKFEKPLRQHLETYRTIVMERSTTYERALREKSQIIRDTEARNMNRKERNLQIFREALTILQRQVDELDELKAAHYQEIIEHEEEVWDVVQGKICIAVRSTMDVFDRVTAKAMDPVIEPMLQSVPDPFDSYGPPQSEDQIFSILAPLSIMANASTSCPSTPTPERNSMVPLPASSSSKIASWLPITGSSPASPTESSEWMPTSTQAQPTLSPLTRRDLVPLPSPPRKAESKLRSILSSIDESQSRLENTGLTSSSDTMPPPTNGRVEQADHSPEHEWGFAPVHLQYEDTNDSNMTPRNSYLFTSHLPPAMPTSLPPASNNNYVSDNAIYGIDTP
ncbi:hypothetical protein F5887DRAFT_994749 [Amanita rubescens]|nr:hypothetical protein F5887DRAFT_994749 [Amanita rubescens]